MIRNVILGLVVVMVCSLALLSCDASRVPTQPIIPPDNTPPDAPRDLQAFAWSYPFPARIHLQWVQSIDPDLLGYNVYRYSIKHNISDYSTLAHSITPYVASLINQITTETAQEENFVLYSTVDKIWDLYDDWGIKPQFIYAYKLRAVDTYGVTSDPSNVAFSATP